jgi:hypothetical protein
MKRFILGCAAVVVMAVAGTNSAQAGGIRFSYGSGGHYHGGHIRGYGHGGHVHGGRFGLYPNVGLYPRGGLWHDTSHWDYHPAQVVPHGNHLHIVPGHYDYHQTGHWHW